jgi:oxygen-independent coproporphyrinogen-3 oxidase
MPALYIHIPFCRQKCPYCDFFSLAGEALLLDAYPDLLCRQLELAAEAGWRGPFETIFFGGGTPSLLPPIAIGAILEKAAACFGIAAGAEISLETNPGTVTAASLAGYRAAGINRLSLGVQSLNDDQLRQLGRIHSPQQALDAIAWARRGGFANLSCDLMFALPGESRRTLLADLEALLQLGPEHLSCYGLTVEEATPFHARQCSGGLTLPDEDEYAEQYLCIDERLTAAGFRHYEIANYARPGRECRHNLRYWQRRSYLGIGAGAHSFCSRGWGERLEVPPDLPRYDEKLARGEDPAESLETFDRRGAMAETFYLGLRTAAGIDAEEFRARFGTAVVEAFPAAVRRAGEHLRLIDGAWRLTPASWLIYNRLIAFFL